MLLSDSPLMAHEAPPPAAQPRARVTVRLRDPQTGRPAAPASVEKITATETEWRARLTPEQYRITRAAATEHPFCGAFHDHKKPGRYDCVCCGLTLFTADAKFDSGTGWPSFFKPFASENITTRTDRSHGMVRDETLCTRCDAHLGHVFNDGPKAAGGLRFCINSAALTFVPDAPAAQTGGQTDH